MLLEALETIKENTVSNRKTRDFYLAKIAVPLDGFKLDSKVLGRLYSSGVACLPCQLINVI